MNKSLKNALSSRFAHLLRTEDPTFEEDSSLKEDPHLFAMRRPGRKGYEFVAITFSQNDNRFFMEAAVAPDVAYPLDLLPVGCDQPAADGRLRFRASELWGNRQSGGWYISPNLDAPNRSLLKPEGEFADSESAVRHAVARATEFVLPFFTRY